MPVSLSQLLWAPSTSLSCPSSLSGNATCLASPGQLLALSAPPASALLQFPSAPVLAGTPFHVAVRLLDAAGAPIMPSVPLLVTLTVDPLSPAALAPPVGSLAVVFAAPGWADLGLSVALSAPQAGALAVLLTLSFAQPPLLSVTASVDVAPCSEGPQSLQRYDPASRSCGCAPGAQRGPDGLCACSGSSQPVFGGDLPATCSGVVASGWEVGIGIGVAAAVVLQAWGARSWLQRRAENVRRAAAARTEAEVRAQLKRVLPGLSSETEILQFACSILPTLFPGASALAAASFSEAVFGEPAGKLEVLEVRCLRPAAQADCESAEQALFTLATAAAAATGLPSRSGSFVSGSVRSSSEADADSFSPRIELIRADPHTTAAPEGVEPMPSVGSISAHSRRSTDHDRREILQLAKRRTPSTIVNGILGRVSARTGARISSVR